MIQEYLTLSNVCMTLMYLLCLKERERLHFDLDAAMELGMDTRVSTVELTLLSLSLPHGFWPCWLSPGHLPLGYYPGSL